MPRPPLLHSVLVDSSAYHALAYPGTTTTTLPGGLSKGGETALKSSWRLQRPPKALRRADVSFDNLAIVPASRLSHRAQYQAIADTLPRGQVLIILPKDNTRQMQTLEKVAKELRGKGHPVTILPAERLPRTCQEENGLVQRANQQRSLPGVR